MGVTAVNRFSCWFVDGYLSPPAPSETPACSAPALQKCEGLWSDVMHGNDTLPLPPPFFFFLPVTMSIIELLL